MADSMAELEIRDLRLAFGGLQVLNGVSVSVERGELLALIGPNGAGKTSILNCVSGIYRPNSGRILFERRDLVGLRPHAIARLGIARTFQHGELFPQMTVLENLLVGRHARFLSGSLAHGPLAHGPIAEGLFLPGVRRQEVQHRRKVEEILEFVELQRYRHHPVGGLPFGLQKVIGFARALTLEPRILLLDEPSAGLNRDEREDLARHILRIKHEVGVAIIWVEHDMQMVADLADRLYVLDYGEHLAQGDPATVLSDPKVVAAYLGRKRSEQPGIPRAS
jgi:branched-chain amino acid transport system ATP-binding protein